MRAGFEAELSELLGLRLLRAFQNLQSDRERLRVVEYVEALDTQTAEAKGVSVVRLVASKLESDEQNDAAPGQDHLV
jgi:hypothetical protein